MPSTLPRPRQILRFASLLFLLASPLTLSGQDSVEAKFRGSIDTANIRESMRRLSARPHHVGSPYDKDNAEWMLARFREWGWDAQIETFDVLFPTPKDRLVEMVAPKRFRAALFEPPVAGDITSTQTDEQLATYNAYSKDGDVTAPLVYVNYGREEDYEELARRGISVQGAIAIVRYGSMWRGNKAKFAAEHGAVGCLIYSDPKDDGYGDAAVFPAGPMRNKDGVQRGSVMDMLQYPGDPLTPGVGAVPGAKRLAVADAPTITKIPVLPISYGDAQPLLEAMTGPIAPENWRGGLPITYHLGKGPAQVHLKVTAYWETKPLYDVIAKIQGSTYPDEWVIRGNHHDAWVNGASDPISGMAPELEEARAFGELLKTGWRPKRTIVYAAWDGEEPALLGSTEWVEQHESDLKTKAVVYINSDGNERGFLSAEGSHTLEHFVNGVAKDIPDPESGVSVWKRLQARRILNGSPESRAEARTRPDLRLGAMGSGSDYSPFIQHAGTPSLALSYGGEDDDGIYHSVYDDFYHYTHFKDTDFAYGRALAQTMGTAIIRLADADLLPFEFTNLSDTVTRYTTELQTLLRQRQDTIRDQNRAIDEKLYDVVRDPKKTAVPPEKKELPPALNFAPLVNATAALTEAANRYHRAAEAATARLASSPEIVKAVNARLMQSERELTDQGGLPGRPWYRHLLYAPGVETGYGAKTMPGAREGIEQGRYAEAEHEIARIAEALQREVRLVDAAAGELERLEK
jgi:N-acetylated-alpha-linked acidic dipeptidase